MLKGLAAQIRAGWVVAGLGLFFALVSVAADGLGMGAEPGFGWKQRAGLVSGIALLIWGIKKLGWSERLPWISSKRNQGGAVSQDRGWVGWGMGLAFIFFIVNWPIVAGEVTPKWDADVQFAPWYLFVADHARAGRLLLWNLWSNAGTPDFAEPQIGAFSPFVIIMGLLTGGGRIQGFNVYWLILWFLGGLGVFFLARHLNAPPWGGFVAGIGFLFCGFFTGQAQHLSHIHCISSLPWMVWRLDTALVRRRWWPAMEAGAILGLAGLAGYPGLIMSNAGFAFLWTVGRAFFQEQEAAFEATPERAARRKNQRGLARRRAMFLRLGLAGVIGLLVLSPTYTGFLMEGRGFSDRVDQLPREVVVRQNALHPKALSTFSSAFFSTVGRIDRAPGYWEYTDISSCSIYTGPFVIWFTLLSLLLGPKDRFKWYLLGMGVLALGLALSVALPFRGWLYDLFPPSGFFRHASMFRTYAVFSWIVLSLLAMRDFIRYQERDVRRLSAGLVVSAASSAAIALVVFLVMLQKIPAAARDSKAIHYTVGIWLTIGVLPGFTLLWPKRSRQQILLGAILVMSVLDAFVTQDLASWTTFSRDPSALEEWKVLGANHRPGLDQTRAGFRRLPYKPEQALTNKHLLTKSPVLACYMAFNNSHHQRWIEEPLLASQATGSQRVWFSRTIAVVPPSDAAFKEFIERSRSLGAMPLVIHEPERLRETTISMRRQPLDDESRRNILSLPPASLPEKIKLHKYEPSALEFSVQVSGPGWLLVTDRWASGWQSMVNEMPVETWGGNFIFRAIPVEAGLNEVKMSYHPFGYPFLLILSWGTLAVVLLGGFWIRRER